MVSKHRTAILGTRACHRFKTTMWVNLQAFDQAYAYDVSMAEDETDVEHGQNQGPNCKGRDRKDKIKEPI